MSGNATVDSFNSASNNQGKRGNERQRDSQRKPRHQWRCVLAQQRHWELQQQVIDKRLARAGKLKRRVDRKSSPGPVTYPVPSAPNPAPPTTTQNIAGSCGTISGCAPNGTKSVISSSGTIWKPERQRWKRRSTSQTGTYNLNSLTLSGNSTLVVDAGGPGSLQHRRQIHHRRQRRARPERWRDVKCQRNGEQSSILLRRLPADLNSLAALAATPSSTRPMQQSTFPADRISMET